MKKQIFGNDSSEEITELERYDDSGYILNGVVDGFSPVLSSMSQTVSSPSAKYLNKKQILRKRNSIGKIGYKHRPEDNTKKIGVKESNHYMYSEKAPPGTKDHNIVKSIASVPNSPKKQRKYRRNRGLKRSQSTGHSIGFD